MQQVLIVERMINDKTIAGDGQGFSEQAYFPRYRESLGIEEGYANSNPIRGPVFKKIWEKLKEELLNLSTLNQSMITFSPGTGRNISSNYPTSQALFTSHDLTQIQDLISPDIKSESNDVEIFSALRTIATQLRKYARNLIRDSGEDRKKQICKQVSSFLAMQKSRTIYSSSEYSLSQKKTIIAYKDFSDFFDDRFEVFVDENGNQLKNNEAIPTIEKKLTDRKVLLLATTDDELDDKYTEILDVDIIDNNSILAIANLNYAESFKRICKRQLFNRNHKSRQQST